MLVEQIGETAGKIWTFLKEKGPSNFSQIERTVRSPKPVVHMAIGWLSREGKLHISQDKRSIVVTLNEN